MYKLNYDPKICETCATIDCLVNCEYLNFKDVDSAKREKEKILEGEYSKVLDNCRTCYGCEEYCPNNNHPFYQIVELQERLHIKNVPDDVMSFLLNKMRPNNKIKKEKLSTPIVNMCLFPKLIESIEGKLFNGASTVWGKDIFCNIMWLHFGKMSVILDRLPRMIKNIYENYIIENGINELICFHDECYAAYTHFAKAYGIDVPFKPIHIFEYLIKRLNNLKNNIKPLNEKVAYQRPCSNRLCPTTDDKLNEIFMLIGVERVKRYYDRQRSLCCGSVMMIKQKTEEAQTIQRENIEDIKKSGVKIVVFNCPMCMMTMQDVLFKQGLSVVLVSDLVKMALN